MYLYDSPSSPSNFSHVPPTLCQIYSFLFFNHSCNKYIYKFINTKT